MKTLDWELRFGYLIHDVSRLRRTLFDRWLSPLGITRSQWWVIAFLSRNDGMPQTALAQELDIGKVALGTLIDRLEDAGFVKRVLDPNDRRVKRVVLTQQSAALLQSLRQRNAEFNQFILAEIPRDDIEVTIKTLRKMKHNLIEGAKQLPAGDAARPQPKARPRAAETLSVGLGSMRKQTLKTASGKRAAR